MKTRSIRIIYSVTKECSIFCRSDRRMNKNERVIVAHTKRILMIQCYLKYGESGNRSVLCTVGSVCASLSKNIWISGYCCVSLEYYEYGSDRICLGMFTVAKAVQCSISTKWKLKIGKSVTKLNPLFRRFSVFVSQIWMNSTNGNALQMFTHALQWWMRFDIRSVTVFYFAFSAIVS